MEDEPRHLVWATHAEDIRLAADALELVMYAATVPHLITMEGLVPQVPDAESAKKTSNSAPSVAQALRKRQFCRLST